MADYGSLLARALDGLSDKSAGMRRTVYERARAALLSQLKTLQPSLDEAAIARECAALEAAIGRIEGTFEAEPWVAASARPTEPAPAVTPLSALPEPAAQAPPPPARPRLASEPAIRRPRRQGSAMVLPAILVAIAVPAGIAAWLWRDRPAPARPAVSTETPAAAAPDSKFGDRIGGPAPSGEPSSRPAARPVPVPGRPVPAPAVRGTGEEATQAAQPELAVAQRAVLVEENQLDQQQPRVTAGRVVWRLDTLNAGQGQPLETVVRADVDLTEARLSLALVIRKNVDAALPASHTLELAFSSPPPRDDGRVVRDVALPQLRQEEGVRGQPLAGLPVPVRENLFLVGLSDLKGDVERNTDMLLRRNWFELPLRFVSGQKAALVFEKGNSGDRVMAEAFRIWGP